MPLRLMFSVGEVSGDAHAARLAREILQIRPDAALFGAGGERMAAAGVDVRVDITDASTFGLADLFDSAPRQLSALRAIRRMLARERPDALVLVDAPGLNFAVASMARRLGIRTVYYVPPQTWLWNPEGAARRMRHAVDTVFAIFEREAHWYARAGANARYHGHPTADLALEAQPGRDAARRTLGIPADAYCVGLFPGSRRPEIRRLLPAMLQAAAIASLRLQPLHVVIGLASTKLRADIERRLGHDTRAQVHVHQNAHEVLDAADVSLAASGTVLLEAVMLDAPAIMTYRIDHLTRLYAKYVLRVRDRLRFYSMPNILVDDEVIPELVVERATPDEMARAIVTYATDVTARERMKAGYARVRARLGQPGVAARVAAELVGIVEAAPTGRRTP
jgi:lipid-A-disaccharide synthase